MEISAPNDTFGFKIPKPTSPTMTATSSAQKLTLLVSIPLTPRISRQTSSNWVDEDPKNLPSRKKPQVGLNYDGLNLKIQDIVLF